MAMHPNYVIKQENENLKLELEVYKKYVVKRNDDYSVLVKENEQLKANSSNLSPKLEGHTQIMNLNHELNNARAQNSHFKQQLDTEQRKNSELLREKKEMETKSVESEAKLRKQEKMLELTKSLLEQSRNRNEVQETQIMTEREEYRKKIMENDRLKKNIMELTQRMAQLERPGGTNNQPVPPFYQSVTPTRKVYSTKNGFPRNHDDDHMNLT